MQELSTGLSIIDSLKRQGYIKEAGDKKDKRSKRLSVTPGGEKVIFSCYEKFTAVVEMLTKDLPEEDIRLCIQLLMPIDATFAPLWKKHKGKSFQTITKEIKSR